MQSWIVIVAKHEYALKLRFVKVLNCKYTNLHKNISSYFENDKSASYDTITTDCIDLKY